MGWERRANGREYYYQGRWDGGRVRKVCLGRGAEAEAEAQRIARERKQSRDDLNAICALDAAVEAPQKLLNELNTAVVFLESAVLYSLGYHRERSRNWRKRRVRNQSSHLRR